MRRFTLMTAVLVTATACAVTVAHASWRVDSSAPVSFSVLLHEGQ